MYSLPPLHLRALLIRIARHVWVEGGMIVVGMGLCFGRAVEAAARTMQKFIDSEFKMAVDKIKGKQTTINIVAHWRINANVIKLWHQFVRRSGSKKGLLQSTEQL